MFKKKDKNLPSEQKQEKIRVKKVGLRRKSVYFLWVLLIGSVAFGIYKNFTAVDTRTEVIERTIEMKLLDTNAVENYVVNFAKVYHSWSKEKEKLDSRLENLNKYMTEPLIVLNTGLLDSTTVTDATVQGVQVWSVDAVEGVDNEYRVLYSVSQKITSYLESVVENKKKQKETKVEAKDVYQTRAFEVKVYVSESEDMLIISSPRVCSLPKKAEDEPGEVVSDGSVVSEVIDEVTDFLGTFFTLYPTATEKELLYYVKDGILKPIDENYTFWELQNLVFLEGKDNSVRVNFYVKYFDEVSQVPQVSQYDFTLEKTDNWKIVAVH